MTRALPCVRFISSVKAQPMETWSPSISFLTSLWVLWLQCMLEDVVLVGCTSILKKKGGSILFKLGLAFSLLAARWCRPAQSREPPKFSRCLV